MGEQTDFNKLINWSNTNFAHLPWRVNRSLYSTWISEVMLQQTTVHTVQSRLGIFLKKFPTIKSLAKASEEELLMAWRGLGYYQRAKNLKRAALKITKDFNGVFPETFSDLEKIPGIGPYTSRALYSVGMNKKALAVDANLERVLSRYYGIEKFKGNKLKEEIQRLFDEKLIFTKNLSGSWREINESLMDLGREICQSRKVYCEICPLQKNCVAKKMGSPLDLPIRESREEIKKKRFELHLLRVICLKGKEIYCYQKPKGTWLAGQYELPTFNCFSEDKSLTQYQKMNIKKYKDLPFVKTTITKYKINNYVMKLDPESFKKKFGKNNFKLFDKNKVLSKLSSASLKVLKKKGEEI